MVFVFSRIVFFAFRRVYKGYNETPTLERQAMHKEFLANATAMLYPIRHYNAEEFELFMKYINFMIMKMTAGLIMTADDMVDALNEFTEMMLNEDD